MKKIAKQLFALMFVLILALGIFPQRADAYVAYHYKTHESALGKNTTVKSYRYKYTYSQYYDLDRYYDYYYYKFTVKETGYCKFTVNDKNAPLYLFKNSYKKNAEPKYTNHFMTLRGEKTYYRVLPKGTYYMYYNTSDKDASVKVSYSFTKCKPSKNYSRNTATDLKKTKMKATVFNPYKDEFSKWYKFKATSSTVTITTKALDYDSPVWYLDLRDSAGNIISTDKYDNKNTITENGNTRKLVRKGMVKGATYYICVNYPGSLSDKYAQRRLMSLTVK